MVWIVTALAGLALSGEERAAPSEKPTLRCEVGPVERTFGGTAWLVYGCEDSASLVVVAQRGNPGMPFVFILSPREGRYALYGEGEGDKSATSRAYEQLKALTPDEIAGLIAEIRRADASGD